MNIIGIYKITNPKNKIYIGKSKNIIERWKHYRYLNNCKQPKLYNSLKKYGYENHKFEIIEECSLEELNKREIYWIKFLGCFKIGLNLTLGGEDGYLKNPSQIQKSIKSSKPIYKFDLQGNFIEKYRGAKEAVNKLGKGNSNNINDCARGKYKSTYGFQWVYEYDIKDVSNPKIPPCPLRPGNIKKWTEKQRIQYKESRKGEKRSKEYGDKMRMIRQKIVFQIDHHNNIINIFPSFKSFNNSGIIGTKKLRNIINKDIYYNGYKYSYNKPNEIK